MQLDPVDYMPWARALARSYSDNNQQYEELESAAYLGLVLAWNGWDGVRDFPPYALPTVRGYILKELEYNSNPDAMSWEDTTDDMVELWDRTNTAKEVEDRATIRQGLKGCTELQAQLLMENKGLGLTERELAQMYGISQQAINAHLNKAQENFRLAVGMTTS
jgi:RNA polymerase sigma factor (sigma-70 family)